MPLSASRILFFVPEQLAGQFPVYLSRVWALASFLQERGANCLIIGSESNPDQAKSVAASLQDRFGVSTILVGRRDQRSGLLANTRAARLAIQSCASEIERLSPTHIYYRSCTLHGQVRRLKRLTGAQVVFDLRGASAQEVRLRRGISLRYIYIRNEERLAIRSADRLACVSDYLRAYMQSVSDHKDVEVIPNCVDDSLFFFDSDARNAIRQELGIDGATKCIVYSGGTSKWQNIDGMLALYNSLLSISDQYYFLFLTKDVASVRQLASQYPGLEAKMNVREVPLHDVHSYLSAADFGIMMRGAHEADLASSPIKVAEYLACGLPVITRYGVGDYVATLPALGIGFTLPENKDDMAAALHLYIQGCDSEKARSSAISFAASHLLRSSYDKEYRDLFSVSGS